MGVICIHLPYLNLWYCSGCVCLKHVSSWLPLMLPRANLFHMFVTVHVMVRAWKLCACIHLTPYVSPSLSHHHWQSWMFLWQLAGMLTPNWSGYMQTVCHGNHPAGHTWSQPVCWRLYLLNTVVCNAVGQDEQYRYALHYIQSATVHQGCWYLQKMAMNIVIRLGGIHTVMNF